MDRKIKLLAASSLIVTLASACTPYNARTGTYDNADNAGYGAGASQNKQQATNTNTAATCAPCRSKTTYTANKGDHNQQWYIDRWNREQNKRTYTPPAPRREYTPPKTTYQAGGHTQQWYIDRWNRQQQTQRNTPKPIYTPPKKTYGGYGGAKPTPTQPYTPPKPYTPPRQPTNYYDYSQGGGNSTTNKQIYTGASKSNAVSNKRLYTGASSSNKASNKSIYTGSPSSNTYKPYEPKTYTGGANSNTYSDASNDIYSGSSNNTYAGASSGSDSYTSSQGGGEVATGSYKAGNSHYTVQKGDTVFSVMRLTGVYWKEIIKKNNLIAPYTISPGKRLRLK